MLTPSTTTVDLNVGYPNIATVVHAVQGDNQSRILTANLYDGGIAWTPPTGAVGVIKFHTPLGTSGMYDTDEEGNTAVTWTGNVATLRIVQNALAVAGDVPMQLSFYDSQGAVITSFLWETLVQPSVLTDTQFMQTDYYNILSQQISAILTAIADIPEPATSTPLMDGNAAVGTQNTFARGDHRHPTDTSRAPTNHASTGTSYGAGNATNYGHVKLSDSTSSTSGTSGGTAATPSAVKAAYDKADGKPDLSSTTPKMDGTAAVGTGTTAARADHVHPSDTSRVPTTRKVNNKALSADITLSASDVGAVPTTRKIRTLTAENISYDDGLSEHTAGSTGEAIAELKGSLNALLGKTITYERKPDATSDISTPVPQGVYVWYITAATPDNFGDGGVILVIAFSTWLIAQLGYSNSGKMYFRQYNTGAWSTWKTINTDTSPIIPPPDFYNSVKKATPTLDGTITSFVADNDGWYQARAVNTNVSGQCETNICNANGGDVYSANYYPEGTYIRAPSTWMYYKSGQTIYYRIWATNSNYSGLFYAPSIT